MNRSIYIWRYLRQNGKIPEVRLQIFRYHDVIYTFVNLKIYQIPPPHVMYSPQQLLPGTLGPPGWVGGSSTTAPARGPGPVLLPRRQTATNGNTTWILRRAGDRRAELLHPAQHTTAVSCDVSPGVNEYVSEGHRLRAVNENLNRMFQTLDYQTHHHCTCAFRIKRCD